MKNIINIDLNWITNVLYKLFSIAAVVMIIDGISNPSKNYQAVIPKLAVKRKEFSDNSDG